MKEPEGSPSERLTDGSSLWMRVLLGSLGLLSFLVLWKLSEHFEWARKGTMPDPLKIPQAFGEELASGRLIPAVMSSLTHYVWGLTLGTVLGYALGLAAATMQRFDAFQAYLARLLRPIPPLAWVVFAIAWFKVSHAGAAFVISIGVFWVNYFAAYAAMKDIDPKYYELARSFGHGSYLRRAWTVTLPGSASGVFAGVRTGIGQAWMTLIAAELLGVPGMGQEMYSAAGVGEYEAVVIYMLAISAMYALSDYLFVLVERKALQWRP